MIALRLLLCFASLALVGIGGRSVSAQTPVPSTLEVPLFPGFDQFGNQFEVVQAYENDQGVKSITAGIYDTGASVVTFSWLDQDFFFPIQGYPPIPTILGAVATADAIGGTLTGQVSQPGRIYAAGASALNIDFNNFAFTYDLTNAVSVGGIQSFVGTTAGSPNLPSIVGTPINVPTPTNPGGLATVMDQTGYTINLGDLDPAFGNIPFEFPDVRFAPSGASLVPTANTYETVTFPVSLFGVDTTGHPGNEISSAPNPMQHNTAVALTPSANPTITLSNQSFLFDTGAQLSIISPSIAAQFGLTDEFGIPIVEPFDTIDVQGAGDKVTGLPGYILDSLTVPRTDGGLVSFTDVPVYVLDVGFGIDGILGMNLFNGADSFAYDPYHVNGPQVSVLFLNDRTLELVTDESDIFGDLDPESSENLILSMLGSRYASGNIVLPGVQLVPEPGAIGLAGSAAAILAFFAWRRRVTSCVRS